MNRLLLLAVALVAVNANAVIKPATKELKCGWQEWLECGAKVAECGATCFECVDEEFEKCPACVLCFGSSASTCIQCLKKAKIGPITPAVSSTAVQLFSQPKCGWQDWLECAGKVAECAVICTACGVDDLLECAPCVLCLGPSAEQCIKCFKKFKLTLEREDKKSIPQISTKLSVKAEPKCGWQEWLECGAKVAECGATCFECVDEEFEKCPACVLCFGSSASTCIQCLKKDALKKTVTFKKDANALALRAEPKCHWQDYLECAAKVAECTPKCLECGLEVELKDCALCVTCFGATAANCISCIGKEKKGIIQQAKSTSVQLGTQPKCAWQDWVECAAKVAECAATCDGDACAGQDFYTCPACLTCFGGSAEQCIKCLAATKAIMMTAA